MTLGCEWIIDADGCSAERLADLAPARGICDRVIESLGLRVVLEPQWHRFPAPGGVTGLYLLGESHLACHTWPESGRATFNLFCCRPRPEFPWTRELRDALGAARVVVRKVTRGGPAADDEVHRDDDARDAHVALIHDVAFDDVAHGDNERTGVPPRPRPTAGVRP